MQDELWDIYDADRVKTGRTHRRGEPLSPGEYHLVVFVWIRTGDGRYFVTRRAPEKQVAPLLWEATGGNALAGEDSLAAALREAKEEAGLTLLPENGVVFESIRNENLRFHADVWLFRQDVSPEQFIPQPGETIAARLAFPDELRAMADEGVTFFQHEHIEPLFLFADMLEREEMFICPPPGTSKEAIEELLADDYHEVGASGSTCDRETAIDVLVWRSLNPPEGSYEIADYTLRRLSENICLATYVLDWRLARGKTRRATVWQLENGVWRAAYHQGTRCSS